MGPGYFRLRLGYDFFVLFGVIGCNECSAVFRTYAGFVFGIPRLRSLQI